MLTPVSTGRRMLAVAMTLETGSDKLRILYKVMLDCCECIAMIIIMTTYPEVMTRPIKTYKMTLSTTTHSSGSTLTTGTTNVRARVEARMLLKFFDGEMAMGFQKVL